MDEKLIRSIGTKKPCREKCTPPDKRPKLNKNQHIVLEWLKSNSNALKVPMLAIYELAGLADEKVRDAYRQLNQEEEFQVLAAFAEWGMKEVAE